MNVPLNSPHRDPELDSLLGAYALDALDPAERERVEVYIGNNPEARNEVDELRESAASLALTPALDTSAPSELWNRISEHLADEPRVTPLRRRARRFPAMSAALAVAAALVVVVLAASVIAVRGRDSSPSDLASAYDAAAKRDDAREVSLTSAQGVSVAHIVVLPDGTGYLRNEGMKPLSADETYQLWALQGDPTKPTAISAGVLGASPDTVAFHTNGAVHGFGLTIEQSPGVIASTQPMYATVSLA
jgi:anti-sigma-K factor RskA